MLTDAWVSTSAGEVIAGAQSRYGPAAPLIHLNKLLHEGRRFAVVAKPCDIAAVRNLGRIDQRVERQIPYCLSFFCGGSLSLKMAENIAAYQGVLEGSSEAPMLYVKMSPQAVLSLMRQEGWHLIDAIVSEPEKATA
jgi:coenzyme F420-reducing hydrogenase beta subunit